MKPIAIFRHFPVDGPGYFATFLDETRIPWQLFRIDAGDAVPTDPSPFSGLGFMGGPMSVNDPLPWIPAVLDVIRRAVILDIPVIGHCLGGQLMAKALGGDVTVSAVKEIGWHEVRLTDAPAVREWFNGQQALAVFQWHGDTFSIPPGAVHMAGSPHCGNQIFALGKHLGMQCHVEMTRELVESWCHNGAGEIAASGGPAVQSAEEMLRNLNTRVAELNHLAAGIYRRWITGLER